MEVKAHLRHLRIAPRKVRLVVNAIRGLSVIRAEEQLRFMNKKSAMPILKLLGSAVANAEHNYKLNREQLVIQSIAVGEAVTLKRWMPKAMGRATPIRHHGSHVQLVVSDKGVKGKAKASAKPEKSLVAKLANREAKKSVKKQPVKKVAN